MPSDETTKALRIALEAVRLFRHAMQQKEPQQLLLFPAFAASALELTQDNITGSIALTADRARK